MISVDKAKKLVLDRVRVEAAEKVDLTSATGRVLAENISVAEDIPCFARSAMDGYALKAADTRKVPATLKIVGDLPAGKVSVLRLRKGEAIRIMTGAPIPQGADSVVMLEDTRERTGRVKIFRCLFAGDNIAPRGEDVKKGELILKKGTCLRAPDIGMIASLGKVRVKVSKRPRVAIISTGDEVIEIKKPLKKGKVRDANSFSLASAVISAGGIPWRLGIARDRKDEIRAKLKKAREADIVLFSGGVSVGKYDLVRNILLDSGIRPVFWKMRTKPGKPTFFGTWGKRFVFGLPGYPVSSLVIFELLVKPAIFKLLGRRSASPERFRAVLDKEVGKHDERRTFLRGKLSLKENGYHIMPAGIQKSGALKSMVVSDALLEIPEKIKRIKRGKRVWVRRI